MRLGSGRGDRVARCWGQALGAGISRTSTATSHVTSAIITAVRHCGSTEPTFSELPLRRYEIGRRDQQHLVPEPPDLSPPEVRAGESLHRHHATGLPAKELQYMCAPEPLTQHGPPRRIRSVDLEHVLGQIQPDHAERGRLFRPSLATGMQLIGLKRCNFQLDALREEDTASSGVFHSALSAPEVAS